MNAEAKKRRSRKGIFTGLIIIALGVILLLRKMGIIIPAWVTSWQMILVIIGFAIGVSSNFRKPASWILMGLGVIFLINDLYYIPFEIREYFWPILIIAIGLVILFRPKRHGRCDFHREGEHKFGHKYSKDYELDEANKIDSISIFNGLKRMVQSKKFKGGDTVTVFGGTEINLLQADFEGTITIDSVVVFGGLKLIVPPNWEVRTNITGIMGGVEDKRVSAVEVVPDDKVLILTGVVLFGGFDIVNY